MTVSSTTKRNSYTGDGSTTTFAYSFKIFDDDDITVILRTTATGTESVQSKTTHYSVTGVGSASGGNVVFGSAPSSAQTVVLLRQTAQTQATDYTPNDPFPAASHEDALDKLTLMTQDQQDELDRSIKLSRTNTMTSTEFTVTATNRANKIFAFDSSGELAVTQEIGTFTGNFAASTAYNVRDLIKDTSTNNIFIVNEAHTSSGSQPLTTNTNSAKYDLIVDAASATTSASAAASSATAAASSASTASTQASNASSSASTASTQASNASSSASTASTQASNASSSATASASSATAAANSATSAASSAASLTTGISSGNVLAAGSGIADDDFIRVNGTAMEGRSASEVLSDIAAAPAAGSSNIVTTGALNSGSITSGFGAIDNGSSAITTTGVITGGTLEATTDTASGDNAAMGYTATEGLILTGQGSTNDVTIKNDADADVLEIPTGTTNVTVAGNITAGGTVSGASALSHRNLIINGAMRVAQRGTSSTGQGGNAGYTTVDRFKHNASNTAGRFTISQTAVTDLPGFANCLKLDCTTADTSIASGEVLIIQTRFEGQNLQQLKKGTSSAEPITLSFYVKGNAAATYTAEFNDQDNGRFNSQEFSVTTSWNRISLTFTGDTTGAFGDDNASSAQLNFWLHAGSEYTGGSHTDNVWHTTSNQRIGDNQTSFFDSTDREFFITGVQMELGEVATEFEHRTFADDLIACERYYQIAAPLAGNGNGSNFKTSVSFKTAMRAQPTLSFTDNDFDVTDGHASNYASTDANPSWTHYISHSGGVVGTANHASISGDARRGTMLLNTTDSLLMDSEL